MQNASILELKNNWTKDAKCKLLEPLSVIKIRKNKIWIENKKKRNKPYSIELEENKNGIQKKGKMRGSGTIICKVKHNMLKKKKKKIEHRTPFSTTNRLPHRKIKSEFRIFRCQVHLRESILTFCSSPAEYKYLIKIL